MLSHSAVLDYANFTASFRRGGRLFTVTPSSVLSDVVASASAELQITLHLASLQMICSGWLHVQKSSLLQHSKGKSAVMMLSMLMLCLL